MEVTQQPQIQGAGKKATQAKRKAFANPLPVGISFTQGNIQGASRTWWDWFNESTKWMTENLFTTAPLYHGWYDPLTKSVWMRDKGEALNLWTHGFFGKGSLSRSEPTWNARKTAEREARERGVLTAEQMTQKRREERRLLKIERARAAVRAGIQLPDGITALGGELREDDVQGPWQGDEDMPVVEAGVSRVKGLKYFSDDVQKAPLDLTNEDEEDQDLSDLSDVEHFQLTLVEAFFLAGMLGCLQVRDNKNAVIPLTTLYHLCMDAQLYTSSLSVTSIRPDNPFLLSYIVYHHFRSLGWVVKNGTKFCVDYLLYKRGPVFSHAEFAVLVIPEYEYGPDAQDTPFVQHHNGGDKSWIWFSMVNRVNTQVQKTLVLAHIKIPRITDQIMNELNTPEGLVKALRRGAFRVKEISIRRWVPARMKA